MQRVIVTPRSLSTGDHPCLARLRSAGFELVFPSRGAQPSEEQLLAVIGGAVGYLAGVEQIGAAVLSAAANLRVISRNGTGVDNIDLDAARARKIVVRRADGANARGVAELTIAHLLCATRELPAAFGSMKAGRWERAKGFELAGRVLGLIGCGRIGRLVAGFALALGMRVLAYDPYPAADFNPGTGFAWSDFDRLIETADVVSLHSPAGGGEHPLLDRQVIARMKRGALLINTARASLVDETALIDALDSGQLSGATVDAFPAEPPADWRLIAHPRVIATPHIGGYTTESVTRAAEVAVDNLLEELAPPPA